MTYTLILRNWKKKKYTHTQSKPKVCRRNKIIKGRHQRHKQYKINKKTNEASNWFYKKTNNIDKLQLDSSGKQRRQKSAISGMRVDITTDLINGKIIKEYCESAYANKLDKLQEPTKSEQSIKDNYLKYNCNLKTVKALSIWRGTKL